MHGEPPGGGGAHSDVDVPAVLPAEEGQGFCGGHDVGVLGGVEGGGGGAGSACGAAASGAAVLVLEATLIALITLVTIVVKLCNQNPSSYSSKPLDTTFFISAYS